MRVSRVNKFNTEIPEYFQYTTGGVYQIEPSDVDLNTIDRLYIEKKTSGIFINWQFDLSNKKFKSFFRPDFINHLNITSDNSEEGSDDAIHKLETVGFNTRRQSTHDIDFSGSNIVPTSASLQDDRIYILDANGHKVFVFDLEGNRVEDEDIDMERGAVSPISMTVIPNGLAYIGYEDTLHDIRPYYLDTGEKVKYNETLELDGITPYIGSFFSHLTFDDEKMYIGRYGNSRVETFDLDGDSRLSKYITGINRNVSGLEVRGNEVVTIENNPPTLRSWAKRK